MFLLRSSAKQVAKLLQPIFWKSLFFKGQKKSCKTLRVLRKLRSLSPCLRSSVSRHGSLLCLFCHLLHSAKAPFRQAAKNPPAAHNFARLRVAAGCGELVDRPSAERLPCVVRSTPRFCQGKDGKTLRSTSHRAVQRPHSSAFLCTAPLLHSQGGSRSLVTVRNPFVPLSLQSVPSLFSSGLFFLNNHKKNRGYFRAQGS